MSDNYKFHCKELLFIWLSDWRGCGRLWLAVLQLYEPYYFWVQNYTSFIIKAGFVHCRYHDYSLYKRIKYKNTYHRVLYFKVTCLVFVYTPKILLCFSDFCVSHIVEHIQRNVKRRIQHGRSFAISTEDSVHILSHQISISG